MSEQPPPPGDLSNFTPQPPQPPQQSPLSARVPEKVARGVFTTGQVVLDGLGEYNERFAPRAAQPASVLFRWHSLHECADGPQPSREDGAPSSQENVSQCRTSA